MAAKGPLNLFLLQADGLVRCRWDGESERVEELNRALEGETVREVARDPFDPKRVYAATLTEIHVSEDAGASWQWLPSGGIDYRDIWTMAVHPTRANEIYVGTLPAAVYVSENGGRSFRELSTFRSLPDYRRWTFPPGAHVAHARCIALDARAPDDIIVGIEEGGVARSRDRGATWEDISGPASATAFPKINDPAGVVPYEMGKHEDGRVYRDVHWVMRHPTRPETLYASTGIGTYQTSDGGKSWIKCEYGMGRAYAIPMVNHPAVPDRLFLGAAENGPASWPGYRTVRAGPYNTVRFSRNLAAQTGGAKSQILRSDDAGGIWGRLAGGLPVGHEHMTCGFAAHPDDHETLCVGYTDGLVYATNNAGDTWYRLKVAASKLYGLRIVPD
ncbi:MAG: WD40/YVTN/BNR-like repeat-containing protein [Chloroflexota bacterium]